MARVASEFVERRHLSSGHVERKDVQVRLRKPAVRRDHLSLAAREVREREPAATEARIPLQELPQLD